MNVSEQFVKRTASAVSCNISLLADRHDYSANRKSKRVQRLCHSQLKAHLFDVPSARMIRLVISK